MKTQDVVVYHSKFPKTRKNPEAAQAQDLQLKKQPEFGKTRDSASLRTFSSYHLSIVRTVSSGDSPVVPQGIIVWPGFYPIEVQT